MSEPHDRIPDELISAYLDGELDTQQRDQVEQLLDSDPRHQQLLEELRTLRETLQSLPRRRLGPDFPERVLRMAEQRSATAAPLTPASKSVPPTGPRASSGGLQRGLFWAAAAVVAAILLSVFAPETGLQRMGPVAQRPPALRARDSTAPPAERAPDAVVRSRIERLEEESANESFARPEARAEDASGDSADGAARLGRHAPAKSDADLFDHEDTSGLAYDVLQPQDAEPPEGASLAADDGRPAISQPALQQAAELAAGEIASTTAERLAGAASGVVSTDLLADAVIHVRLPQAEKSPQARLTDNLSRNQIAIVQQEPSAARWGLASPAPISKEREVYLSNQAAVDYYAYAPTAPESKPVQLYFVNASVPQIANAVNELQQEGGTVLAALTEEGPPDAHFAFGQEGEAQAERFTRGLGVTASKGAFAEPSAEDHRVDQDDDAWYDIVEGTKTSDEKFGTWNRQTPARRAQSQATVRPEETPGMRPDSAAPEYDRQQTSGPEAASRPESPAAVRPMAERSLNDLPRDGVAQQQRGDASAPSPLGERGGVAQANENGAQPPQRGSVQVGQAIVPTDSLQLQRRYPLRVLFRDPQELQQQLVDLNEGIGDGRPLKVLFVLHDEADLAAPSVDAAPAVAAPIAEPAPADPR